MPKGGRSKTMKKYINYAKAFNAEEKVISWLENNLVKHLEKNQENQTEIDDINANPSMPSSPAGSYSWAETTRFGSENFVFIEDNSFGFNRHDVAANDEVHYVARYNYIKSETDYGSPMNLTYEDDYFAVYAKYVNKLGGGKAFNLEGYAMLDRYDDPTDDGTNREVNIGGDYYFNRRISLGGSLSKNTGDNKSSEGDRLEVDFNAFINPMVALGVKRGIFEAENSEGADDETLDFYVKVRF